MITQVFCDGGVVGLNPSKIAVTWAWCHVNGWERLAEASGYITPAAAVEGLEALPDGWSGQLLTDSEVTFARLSLRGTKKGISDSLWNRLNCTLGRLGPVEPKLLKGHPTRKQIIAGYARKTARGGRKYTIPVSKQHWPGANCRPRPDNWLTRAKSTARPALTPSLGHGQGGTIQNFPDERKIVHNLMIRKREAKIQDKLEKLTWTTRAMRAIFSRTRQGGRHELHRSGGFAVTEEAIRNIAMAWRHRLSEAEQQRDQLLAVVGRRCQQSERDVIHTLTKESR